jgi:hypothetical protein
MRDESLFIYAYQGQTTIHPLGLSLLIILGVATLIVKRRSAVIPMLIMACFVAPAQRIVVFGLDFNFIRILVLVGWARIFIKKETGAFVWKTIDKVIIVWAISSFTAYVMLRGSTGAFVYKLGTSFDSLGMYFLFRCLIRNLEDLKNIVISLICLSIPVAVFLLIEKHTGRNIFSVFGGVPEFTVIRQGKLRAQGAFAHSILAGCFWVTQLPLFLALFWQDTKKWLIIAGTIATLVVIYACASSTPAAGLGAVLLGGFFFTLRHRMSTVRWGVLATLIGLHLVMKAPVWHLISRIDIVGGSTGWHRYILIDQTIHRFGEWWLFGTISTAHWGWQLFDTANMYVNEAVRGGFLTLILFVIILALAFQEVGRLLSTLENNKADYYLAWALGVSLFTHCMIFIAVSYFGQIIVVWYLLLASIASLTPVAGTVPASGENPPIQLSKRIKITW